MKKNKKKNFKNARIQFFCWPFKVKICYVETMKIYFLKVSMVIILESTRFITMF